MTKMLSELLGAAEPDFSLSINQLERLSGQPSADIRLSSAILQATQKKLFELGLDPKNVSAEELYEALKQRLLTDNERLMQYIGQPIGASSPEILAGIRRLVRGLKVPRSCFALRFSVAKRLIKKLEPAKTMKQLGYRSLESMLKHEPLPQLYAATLIYESLEWQRVFTEQYKALSPSAFESREIEIFYPTSRRWEKIAEDFAKRYHHTHLAFNELGAVVVLPISDSLQALAISSVLLILESLNQIRLSSTFLKLQQVRSDFGSLVAQVASGEPLKAAELSGLALPWRTLQQYFDSASYNAALFEPHVQPEDLKLAHAEVALAEAVPALAFWLSTSSLALTNHGQIVSLNMLDVALSAVNDLPFDRRSLDHLRQNVWQDLLSKYLSHQNLEQVISQLSDSLIEPAPALAEEFA